MHSHQKLEEARNGFFSRTSGESIALQHFCFQSCDTNVTLMAFKIVEESIPVALSHQDCADLLLP
jgi:hypothetical protein